MAASPSARTVYLKIHPTARTFSERREVLRVLERFGEVTMFKSYKYNPRLPTPNTFLALFASEAAAKDLINASPIRYTLITNPSPPPSDPISEPISSTISRDIPLSPLTAQNQPPTAEPFSHPYQLHAYPSSHHHTAFLSSPLHSPFRGPWKPIQPSQSYISSSLSQIIPPSIYSAGLMDWEVRRDPEDGGKGEGAGFWVQGRQVKRVEKGRPRVMGGLKELRERGGESQVEKGD